MVRLRLLLQVFLISFYSMLFSQIFHHQHHYIRPRTVLAFQPPVLTSRLPNSATALRFSKRSVASTTSAARKNPSVIPASLWNRRNIPSHHYESHRLSFSSVSSSSSSVVEEAIDIDETQEDSEMAPIYPKFQNIAELHPILKANVRALKLETMTEIQAKTWEAASNGEDVLGRARTGTGKTVAFLLPAIQQLLLQNENTVAVKDQTKIQMLILSPTRELAAQIHDQALKLTRTGNHIISHQCMFGGSSKPADIKMLEKHVPSILVATPGRLKDHIENTLLHNGKRSFQSLLSNVQILVLDETDRLLDMGFKRDVEAIMSRLPNKEQRQTLLFSATVPAEVKDVIRTTMRKKYVTVDCIHDTDPASHTNAQVSQSHVIVSADDRLVSGTVDIIRKIITDTKQDKEPLKLVVFFNTAHLVGYYARLFMSMSSITQQLPIFELHSRKSQAFRTRTALSFRNATEAILFTSDVSARGVDYPGVTDVLQFGIPDSRESYIHRLGRTGRAGKQGEGMIVLSHLEVAFLQQLTGLDVPVNEPYQKVIDLPPSTPAFDHIMNEVGRGGEEEVAAAAASAYRSMIGFYNGKLSKLGHPGSDALIKFANTFVKQTGLKELPEIEMLTIKKMGLQNYVGLNVVYKTSNRLGGGRGEYGRGKTGKAFENRPARGGPGRGAVRDGGNGSNRYMSTAAHASTAVPMNRSVAVGEANRDHQSQATHSPKKPRSDSVNTDEAAPAKKNRRRRPAGRGGSGGGRGGGPTNM